MKKLCYLTFIVVVARYQVASALPRVAGPSHAEYGISSGCLKEDGSNNYDSFDCLLGTAFSRAPEVCDERPQATDCVLNYLGAFCGDLIDSRKKADNPILDVDLSIETCVRKIALGPCVANPTGAACQSGLFAGITFPAPPTISSKRDEPIAHYTLFPDERVKDHTFENFVVGLAKGAFNTISDTIHMFRHMSDAEHAIRCYAYALGLWSAMLRDKCTKIWVNSEIMKPAWNLAYSNRIQRAGAIVIDVISCFLLVEDAALAAKAMNARVWAELRSLFKIAETAVAELGGKIAKGFKILGAGKGPKTVEIFKLGPKGDILPFASAEESQIALDEAFETEFRNCIRVKTKIGRSGVGTSMVNLACTPSTSADLSVDLSGLSLDDSVAMDVDAEEAVPALAPTQWLELAPVEAPNLAAESQTDLAAIHNAYFGFTERGTEAAATWGEFEPWATRIQAAASPAEKGAIATEFAAQYDLTAEEASAIRDWCESYTVRPKALIAAFERLPNYHGLCTRRTRMTQDTIDMLVNGWEGGGPFGEPGIYDVSDLAVNHRSVNYEDPFEPVRFILAGTPGLVKYRGPEAVVSGFTHTFVIRSRFGKYITPVTQGQEELAFLEGQQGRFKLLGWAKNRSGAPAVFYFDNIV